jgi:hypothetical protein
MVAPGHAGMLQLAKFWIAKFVFDTENGEHTICAALQVMAPTSNE